MKRTFSLIVLMAVMCSCLAMTAHAADYCGPRVPPRCAEVPDAARLVPILFFHGRVEGYGAESWRFLSG